jgi:hypothetical protein
MSAVIFPFPKGRRAASPGPAASQHFNMEIQAIIVSIQEACGHYGWLPAGNSGEISLTSGAAALEAALFHAMTLSGCREEDRELRNLLNARLSART